MPDQPIIAFTCAVKFRQWLAKHYAAHPGIWMEIAKKDSGIASITYAEALDEALCFGWIDGQKKSFDETAWLQKFTERGPRSVWSKINTGERASIEPVSFNQTALGRCPGLSPVGLSAPPPMSDFGATS